MATEDQDSGFVQWGLRFFDYDPYLHSGYHGDIVQHDANDIYHGRYFRNNDDDDAESSNNVESDEIIARTLQEEFSQLAMEETSQYSHAQDEHTMRETSQDHDWNSSSTRNYSSGFEYGQDENEDTGPSSSCSSPDDGEEDPYSLKITDEYLLDDEVGKRLNQMVAIRHVPRINGEIPSVDEATSDHERLLNRLQLYGFVEHKVEGDGNCQFRALSDQLYNTPEHHKSVRRQIVTQLKSHPEMYEGYVPMEYSEYLKKMSMSGEWGDHVTLQAAADLFGVKIVVITSFKDTCYIEILPNVEKVKRAICLSFWAEVHYNSIYSQYVLMRNEQSARAVASIPTSSVARHFPTSVLLQEQRDEYRPLLQVFKEDKTSQATSDWKKMEIEASFVEEKNSGDLDQLVQDLEHQFLHLPDLWNLLPPMKTREDPSLSLTMQSLSNDTEGSEDVEQFDAVALAWKALSASKEAASLAKNPKLNSAEFTDIALTSSLGFPLEEVKTVRSTRFLERQSKKRRVSKPQLMGHETYTSRKASAKKKLSEGFDPNDPLRLFLWGPETRTLLTAEEEFELIAQIQDLIRLEKEKSKLQSQFGREPTLIEWAKAVGLSCRDLKSELHSGYSSREKLINANLRLVVHVAKQYQGRGISLHDLFQEGSMGLMKSVEKFKPQGGCRFASYAYWWVRQTIRKAIFQHSRTIRLPENIYTLLSKVLEAKRLCIQEGNHSPDKEDLARRVGITVEKLERLMFITRMPLSMQQPVWADQDTTFQEITADTGVEIPDISVQKQMMRQHVRNLLSFLNPKERHIVRLRFGIEDGKPKSLSEVGNIFGLSKERVRQLESRALYRLKQSLGGNANYGYADLLI